MSGARTILLFVMSLSLSATLLLGGAAPASAEPSPAPPAQGRVPSSQGSSSSQTGTIHSSYGGEKKSADMWYDTVKKSPRSGKTIHYNKMAKVYGKYVTRRRESAAGWTLGGGKLDHISKSERAKVAKIAKAYKKKQKLSTPSSVDRGSSSDPLRAPNCKGSTYSNYSPSYGWQFAFGLDSCDTNAFIHVLGICTVSMTYATAMLVLATGPSAALVTGFFLFVCGISKEVVTNAKENSDLSAISVWVKVPQKNKGKQRWDTDFVIFPQ